MFKLFDIPQLIGLIEHYLFFPVRERVYGIRTNVILQISNYKKVALDHKTVILRNLWFYLEGIFSLVN